MRKIEVIRRNLKDFSSCEEEGEANAAVSIILKVFNLDLYLLIVKRVESPRDPWSAHFSLPGGKRESKDRSLLDTVVRETMEEVGINLGESILLGVAETERSQSYPNVIVLPFVFLLKNESVIKLNEHELERYDWVSVSALLDNEKTIKVGSEMHPAFIVGDIVIWGLTYRILKKVLQDMKSYENMVETSI
ncbi:MAG: CoA pyrophosphatase [Candidatus Bathyarchaeota archaeon]|nr:CoA pyrophosphatase [Candidatus Bathyarchaeota archaeon]